MSAFIKACLIALTGASALSGCTNIPTRIHNPGVAIETVSNEMVQIRSVGYWSDRDGLSLRGEILTASPDGTLQDGHIDIAITVPDRPGVVCETAPLYRENSHRDADFSHSFTSLPPRGSRVRVSYHPATMTHDDCAS